MRGFAACCLLTCGAPLTAAPIDELTWLAGCWAAERGDAGSGESWTTPAGATVLGTSRTVRGGRTVAHEFMLIVDSPHGLTFIAAPSAKPAASFRAIRVEPRRVTFENPDKDFPQRVIYESPDDATLVGRIEGRHDGLARQVDFPMKRVPCPGGAR
ncbi:MAG TPA: DUF6265 family protein [Burkholderiaceae bacterium]|nr:DUF6265 family protein [Burkholderiaceae bacterium]